MHYTPLSPHNTFTVRNYSSSLPSETTKIQCLLSLCCPVSRFMLIMFCGGFCVIKSQFKLLFIASYNPISKAGHKSFFRYASQFIYWHGKMLGNKIHKPIMNQNLPNKTENSQNKIYKQRTCGADEYVLCLYLHETCLHIFFFVRLSGPPFPYADLSVRSALINSSEQSTLHITLFSNI